MNPVIMQLTSGLLWVLYGSVFEWYWHRFWMHQLRHPKEAFRGHAVVHHGLYRGDDSYFVTEEHVEHILLKPYALPAIFLMHLPVVWLIDRYLVANTAIGAMTACVLYFVIYEYMHYNMHVPRGQWVERFRWFQFLRQHHKLHHKYQQKNFCVLFPLADWIFGTMVTDASLARQKAEREAALAQGISMQDLKQRRKRAKGRA